MRIDSYFVSGPRGWLLLLLGLFLLGCDGAGQGDQAAKLEGDESGINQVDPVNGDSRVENQPPQTAEPPQTADQPDRSSNPADSPTEKVPAPSEQVPTPSDGDSGQETTQDTPPADESLSSTGLENIPLPDESEGTEDYVPYRERKQIQTIDIPESWKRLSEQQEIWIDMGEKRLIAAGEICLNRGGLEMFVCPLGTKEHESVIALNAHAHQVHAGLLALGAEAGKPVQWEPEYQQATGAQIAIEVRWKDGDAVVRRNGRELVRNFRTRKELDTDWVFGGSMTDKDPRTGETYYYADGGELVCVSNFATATLDLPIESSQADASLMFEANTEKLPPVGTKCYVLFQEVKPTAEPDDVAAANGKGSAAESDVAASSSSEDAGKQPPQDPAGEGGP